MVKKKEIKACKVANGDESPKNYNKEIYFNLMIGDKPNPDVEFTPLIKITGKTFKDIEKLLCNQVKRCLKLYKDL